MAKQGFSTRCVHGAQRSDTRWHQAQPVSTPIFQTSTFAFENADHGAAIFAGENDGFLYTRLGNPTQEGLEEKMAAIEGGQAALALASGMAACTTAVLTLCESGDHIVAGDTLYGGTHQLFTHTLPRLGISVTEVKADDPANFAAAITDRTRLIYLESPANPTLVLTDIAAVAEVAHARGIPVLVDNTFCTPYLQRPLELGADIVLHSATKYIGGHGDAIAGVLIGGEEFITRARFETLRDVGGCISPFNAWLLIRGLKTLPVRMDRHCRNAQIVAEWLTTHPKVTRVI
ncbi:aminotransferase class I/II-fold pyridoxal phosphate-dependent enzyme, partial [bacterium]|nr:aminotransferase class I/II-fold pyridoxal phosphate-dependent enzyme [bacterium]